VDPSAPVIQNLKDSDIPKSNKIILHHKKGQDITIPHPGENCIFIAGMGGNEILEMAQHFLRSLRVGDDLIISPHRKVLELRKWLSTSAYRLKGEGVIFEDDQYYPFLQLSLDHSFGPVSLYGENLWKSLDGANYRIHQIQYFDKHQDSVSKEYVAYLRSLNNG